MARAGGVEREENYEPRLLDPPLPQAAGVQHFFLGDESPAAGGSRPDGLAPVSGPQKRVLWHTVEQLADCVPVVPLIDALVPQSVDQLVDVFKHIDISVPEQVIEVPRSCVQLDFLALFSPPGRWWNSWWKCRGSPRRVFSVFLTRRWRTSWSTGG